MHLARLEGDLPVSATALAAVTDVPENYLRKVLHELVRGGVLLSIRGKHGGFRLAVPADQLTLLGVVARFDRIPPRRTCLLGRAECSDTHPCPLHARWKGMADELERFFGQTTIAEIARDGDLEDQQPHG